MKKIFILFIILSFTGFSCNTFVRENLGVETAMAAVEPEETFEKWDTSISLKHDMEPVVPYIDEEGRKVWEYEDRRIVTYYIEPNEEIKDGGFEYEVVFKHKPDNNKVDIEIGSTNLDFYYQAPLDEIDHSEDNIDYCTQTHCYDADGEVIIHRPENIVDSYAVYHSSKKNHNDSEINYRAGKVYHIYRSKIIDNNGDWVWADRMEISNGKMTITVPEDFLETASYPVIVDPTLGYTTDPGTMSNLQPDTIRLVDYDDGGSLTMSEDGTASSVWVYMGGSGGTDAFKTAIYDDSGGTPDGLVDESTEQTSYPGSAQWVEFTGFDASLSNGSVYYPAIWHDHAWNNIQVGYDDSDGDDGYYEDSETYGSWPDPLSEGSQSQVWRNYGHYIEYTVGASLTFSATTDVFPNITPGSPVFATTTLSVDTSNASGWNVTMSGDNQGSISASTTMYLSGDYDTGIPDQTEWIPGAATTTAGNAVRISSLDNSGDVLAFRVMTASGTAAFSPTSWWGTTDAYTDNANTLWAGIASSSAANLKIGDSSVSSGGGAVLNTVLYYLDVANTQITGSYTGDLTFTAAVNP